MTDHAIQRIAERFPGHDPRMVLALIARSIDTAPGHGITVTGERVIEVALPDGTPIFALIKSDGGIVTALAEGMDFEGTQGRVPLRRLGLTPGIHFDVPEARYHADQMTADPTLSSSIAKLMLRSPLHAWTAHPRLNPDREPVEKKVFDIGRAAHRAVLGRGGDYVAIPDDMLASNGAASTKAAKDFIEQARAAGLTPLKAAEVDQIGAMADRLRQRMLEYGIEIDPARSEVTALAEIDGVVCKCRVDNAPEALMRIPGIPTPRRVMIDLKTCEDASPEAVRRAVESYGYDLQAGHYTETWRAATGEDRDMLFVFVEKSPPHEVTVIHLLAEPGHSGDWFEDARAKSAATRALWQECLTTNRWPGYPAGIITIEARSFYRQGWQDRAAMISQTSKPAAAALRAAYDAQAPHRMAGE